MDAVRPAFLPSHKGKKPSNPLGKVHAITTANVPVDNTLHNKQTGEGGRANSDTKRKLEPKWLLVQLFIKFNKYINNSNKGRNIEPS